MHWTHKASFTRHRQSQKVVGQGHKV